MSHSYSRSSTFTITEARKLASKVEADLYLCLRYYGRPSATFIPEYAEELAQMLKAGYVREYEFGFQNSDKRIVCWRYRVASDGTLQTDDRAGRVFAHADVSGSTYYNILSYSARWFELTSEEQKKVERDLPFTRTTGSLPTDGSGYWIASDKTYSASSIGLGRSTFRPL